MKVFWQSLLSAAASGAAGAAGNVVLNGGKVSWGAVGTTAGIGALIGVINFLKSSPLQPKVEPAPVEPPKA